MVEDAGVIFPRTRNNLIDRCARIRGIFVIAYGFRTRNLPCETR
jgi:hypothetical protein